MKKFLAVCFFAVLMAIGMAHASHAMASTRITIEGEPVVFANQGPVTISGVTLVPMRDVFEPLGFELSWNPEARQATMANGRYVFTFTVGRITYEKNGTAYRLEVPVQIIGGSVMVPMRQVVESAGYYVGWHQATRTASITSQPVCTARQFVYFDQRDPRWRDVPFGSFTVANGGCGPTSIAMVVSTLHGAEVLPCYVTTWGRRFYVAGVGSAHALFTSNITHDYFGLNFTTISVGREQDIITALEGGAMMITSVQSRNSPNAREGSQGLFTINPEGMGGHVVVIHGITEDGNLLIASPMNTALVENTQGFPLSVLRREMHRGVNELWVFTLDENAQVEFGGCHLR